MHDSHYIIITAILLLSIASIGGILTSYFKIPYMSMLVLIGLVVGLFHIFPSLKITPSLIYYVFLPIIIFEGAVNIRIGPLISNALPISVLSILGTVISAIFIGTVFHFVLDFPLKQSLIFGAIITPTDPISILALLKNKIIEKTGGEEGKNSGKDIETLLSSESLLNDGISLVLFEVFLGLNISGGGSVFLNGNISGAFQYILGIIGISALKFLYISIGGSVK